MDDTPSNEPKEPDKTEAETPSDSPLSELTDSPAKASTSLAEALAPPPETTAAEQYLQRAQLAEDRLAEVLAAFREFKKENTGHRERVTKNVERRFRQQHEGLLLKFIDILDNFDRALDATATTMAGEALVDGLILVRTQLLQSLQEEGLERIPVVGHPFDPELAEAVETVEVEDPEKHDIVIQELLRGYRVYGRIARPANVIVGRFHRADDGIDASPAGASAVEPGGVLEGQVAPQGDAASDLATDGPSLEDIIAQTESEEPDEPKKSD